MVYARYLCGRNLECCEMLNTIAKQVAMISESSIRTALITIGHNAVRDPASCRGRLVISLSVHHIGMHELRVSVLVVSLRSVAIRQFASWHHRKRLLMLCHHKTTVVHSVTTRLYSVSYVTTELYILCSVTARQTFYANYRQTMHFTFCY